MERWPLPSSHCPLYIGNFLGVDICRARQVHWSDQMDQGLQAYIVKHLVGNTVDTRLTTTINHSLRAYTL